MNRYIYIILLSLCICSTKIVAQNISDAPIPKENVYIHFNTSFLVTGERIYYKLYCINTKTKNISTLSKIAYVELIDSNSKSVFKHKIKLDQGVGFGTYFIPSTIKSGNYKLIGYTQWMLNWSDNFFQNDISIINPFEKNQPDILIKSDSTYTINNELINPLKTIPQQRSTNTNLSLSVEKDNYGKREKVQLKINTNLTNSLGKYSISVNKIDSIVISEMYSSINYKQISEKSKPKNISFFPELRGELISGKVLDSTNKPVQNSKVAVSIPGNNFLFKIATTNDKGNFYTYLNQSYESDKAIFQILNSQDNKHSIFIDSIKGLETNNLQFSDFKLTPAMQKIILNRSIQSQIENSYSSVKLNVEDSLLPIEPFYQSKITKTYVLDNYTRFPSVKETVVEIMPDVYVKTRKKKSTLHVIITTDNLDSETLPMLIIDGVLVQNHQELLDLNSNSIDKIHIIGSQYLYGTQIYEGIIAVETKNGNYTTTSKGDFIKSMILFKPITNKTYFKQKYHDNSNYDRIPDYRNLLFWHPTLKLNKHTNELFFYTSDVTGYFNIRLEGFNADGSPVSLQKVIKVK